VLLAADTGGLAEPGHHLGVDVLGPLQLEGVEVVTRGVRLDATESRALETAR
jgi:hypothetical protein